MSYPFNANRILLFIFLFSVSVSLATGFDELYTDEGEASFYANLFHGRITANGEVFNNLDLTAAHLELPFGTFVNVKNTENGRNVIVRINDRGPYIKGRIIDLSQAAMRMLRGYDEGVVPVKLNELRYLPDKDSLRGMFLHSPVVNSLGRASKLRDHSLSVWHSSDLEHVVYFANDFYLKEPYNEVLIVTSESGRKRHYHVVITGIGSAEEVEALKKKYYSAGYVRARVFSSE
jgi:rare lipoprotein A